MKWLFYILLFIPFLHSEAQYNPENVSPKAAKIYSSALEAAHASQYKEAIALLQEAIRQQPGFADAWLSMAGIYGELKQYPAAVENYEKARKIDSAYFMEFCLPYSIDLAGLGHFNEALDAVNLFLTIPNLKEGAQKAGNYRKSCYEFALDYEKGHPRNYEFLPENLGDSVNSAESEYYPSLAIEGDKLIFTRRVNDNNEDFFESNKVDGHWSKARSLEGNINTNMNEGAQNISQDGQWLVFTGCNFPEGYGSCDIYISFLEKEGWSSPVNLGNRVNTEFWESAPSLSPDKKDLYFTSNRPGGYGGKDIYVSHLQRNGQWGEPENLGPLINTVGDESAPFIHADNESLYFTSNGHPGYGGDDLFVSRKDSAGNWTRPVNLGYPVNTIDNEGSIVVTADGKTAYYASDRSDSRGGLDLYQFSLREDLRPSRTLWIRGRVYDLKTGKGLPSSLSLTNLSTRLVISQVQTDELGNYFITLPLGKNYAFKVNRRGYLFYSENFPFKEKLPDSTYLIDIPLQPIEADARIILKNIFFDINKSDIRAESYVELNEVVSLLKENPVVRIEISGHTDNMGKTADNQKLSESRARAVVGWLVSNGINPQRLTFKGFGDTRPVSDNGTEASRAKNRRTELRIVGK
jgi:outer membrane protein OmpA-like peptidoglycan-associated protein/tetratricopeptide (TPR) repeat protein